MAQEQPRLHIDFKGELLKRVTQRYPSFDVEAVELAMLLKHVSEGISAEFESQLAERRISEGKFYVIAYLHLEHLVGRDAPIPSAIAAHLGVTRATVTGLLDGLERDGYIERRHSLTDRRSLVIGLTERAQAFMDEFIPASGCCMDTLTDALTGPERATLRRLLAKVETKLKVSNGMGENCPRPVTESAIAVP